MGGFFLFVNDSKHDIIRIETFVQNRMSDILLILRNEIRQGNKILNEECEIFYPDLSKFAEKEYEPPIYK